MKINIFYRKKAVNRHSIEKVYDTLIPYFKSFNIQKIELPYQSIGFYKRILNIVFATKNQALINHISGDVNYINLFMPKKKTILTIHDIYPLFRTTGIRKLLLRIFWFTIPIKKSIIIITISEFSKKEIIKHFNISENKIQVIPNCVSSQFKPYSKKFNTDCPSILHLGTKSNKNLIRLIEAIKNLTVELVIVGTLSAIQTNTLKKYNIKYQNFKNISNNQLVKLYQTSDLVSFISTYEGFGLPIVEAQATGRIVITSNTASMPEVAGEGALFINPYNIDEIRDGITKIINEDSFRKDIIEKGYENVKRFEPQKIANQYNDLYKEVIDAQ